MLLQVVVAVLLDNFFRVSHQHQAEELAARSAHERHLDDVLMQKERYHLDFFLEYLVKNFRTEEDIHERIQRMYTFLDHDRSGSIEYLELSQGLFRLKSSMNKAHLAASNLPPNHPKNLDTQPMRMTREEWQHLTAGLLDGDGGLSRAAFTQLVVRRLKIHIQTKVANVIKYNQDNDEHSSDLQAALICFKYLLMTDHSDHFSSPRAAGRPLTRGAQICAPASAMPIMLDGPAGGREPAAPSHGDKRRPGHGGGEMKRWVEWVSSADTDCAAPSEQELPAADEGFSAILDSQVS